MRLARAIDGMRLVIFDADDTLRRTTVPGQPCPCAPDEWELLPGVREQFAAVPWNRSTVRVGVASNQDWIGYGRLARHTSEQLLHDLVRVASAGCVRDPLVRLCPHVASDGCACRKPRPGMLLDLMRAAGVAPHATLYIGNAAMDAEAARRAGTHFLWSRTVFGG